MKTLIAQGTSPASLKERGKEAFGVLAKAWLASRHDLKPRTRTTYEMLLADKVRQTGPDDLSIAATFNPKPINSITREQITEWIGKLHAAQKSVSTIRHNYVIVRAVLTQAVVDSRITVNPADHVKLPTERTANGGTPGVVDDPSQFLSAQQVQALTESTPYPFDVYVHLAAWSGLRAGELAGLQIQDVEIPDLPTKPATLRVERTVITSPGGLVYDSPKTKGSRRRVPLPTETSALLTDYLASHPRRNEPEAYLFPNPTVKAFSETQTLSIDEAQAALALDWDSLLNHLNFYRLVFKPAVSRANTETEILPPNLTFHALRHTYASLCVAAGIPPLAISRFMGHSKVTTTLSVYTHLFQDDHSDAMSALAALSRPAAANVVPMRKRG